MARYQHGSVRIEQRSDGPTWVYRFQVTRFDGKRVEHKTVLSLVRDVGPILRHEDVRTTMQLYVESDQESRLEAQGKFLEVLLGDKAHLLSETIQ